MGFSFGLRRKRGRIESGVDDDRARRLEDELALEVERRAKVRAPVDSGRLRSSIRAGRGPDHAFVAVDVEYAGFQEFGTGRAGAATDPGPTPSWYRHGASPGQPSQAFLRPAFHEVVGTAAEVLKRSR